MIGAILGGLFAGAWLLLGRRSLNARKDAGQVLTEGQIVAQTFAGPFRVDRIRAKLDEG